MLAATDEASLVAACRSVVTTYRVYKVVHPQVFLMAKAYAWQNRLDALDAAIVTQTARAITDAKFVKKLGEVSARVAYSRPKVTNVTTNAPLVTASSYNLATKATDKQFREMRRDLERVRGKIKSAEHKVHQLERYKAKTK